MDIVKAHLSIDHIGRAKHTRISSSRVDFGVGRHFASECLLRTKSSGLARRKHCMRYDIGSEVACLIHR